MAHKFRELIVWQRAMVIVTDVYALTRAFPREEQFGLTSQICRAAASIPLNIAEGAGSDSANEFARFLMIARRSAYETMTGLELSEPLAYSQPSQVQPLLNELDSIAAMLSVLIKRLKQRDDQSSIRENSAGYTVDSAAESDYRLLISDDVSATESDYRLPTTGIPVVLRDATEGDIPTIIAVTRAAFEEYNGVLNPPSSVPQETPAKVRDKLASGHGVLALLADQVVGSVYYSPESEYMYLGRLAVLPVYRGRGIGTALIAEVERRARAAGLARVRLGVRVALPHLRARYERLGYCVYEQRRHEGFAEPTYLMMEKVL